jgi:Uma2 family endonuclease
MAVATLAPIEEYLSTSWRPDREYVNGRLIERNVGELHHSCLQGSVAKLLDRNGLLPFISVRMQVQPDRFRIPDVAAVRGPSPAGRFLRQPPYVAVEILSRDDRKSDLDDKIEDYLDFGVENIWVVDSKRLRVTIQTREGRKICINTVETSDGAISIPLSEVFKDMPSAKDE